MQGQVVCLLSFGCQGYFAQSGFHFDFVMYGNSLCYRCCLSVALTETTTSQVWSRDSNNLNELFVGCHESFACLYGQLFLSLLQKRSFISKVIVQLFCWELAGDKRRCILVFKWLDCQCVSFLTVDVEVLFEAEFSEA